MFLIFLYPLLHILAMATETILHLNSEQRKAETGLSDLTVMELNLHGQ